MASLLSAHRDALLKSLVDDHLSYTVRKVAVLEPARVSLLVRALQAHQLLRPGDAPTAFVTPIAPPTAEEKHAHSVIKSHHQTIARFINAVERLISSKGKSSCCSPPFLLLAD